MFSKIQLLGGTSHNYMQIFDGRIDNTVVTNIINKKIYTPDWNNTVVTVNSGIKTYMLSTFKHNIDASNFTEGTGGEVKGYIVMKQNINNDILEEVGKFDENIKNITDCKIQNNNDYIYRILTVKENNDVETMSSFSESETIHTHWSNWSVMGFKEDENNNNHYILDEDNIWKFKFNVNGGQNTINTDKTIYDNFTKFPKVSRGKKNYYTGSINGLLTQMNYDTYEFIDTQEMQEKWKSFISNDELKVLKDKKGNMFEIEITESQLTTISESYENYTQLSFSYIQIGDLNDISIYKVGE